MKRTSPLWGSISILIGVVIAILALLRGIWATVLLLVAFAVWGLWLILTQLLPAWKSNRIYRRRERQFRNQQENAAGSTDSGVSTQMGLNTENLTEVVSRAAACFKITESESNGILQHLHTDGDYTLYGLANAVTRYSQDVESYDHASKLEEIGYTVMTMAPELFRRINQVTDMAT